MENKNVKYDVALSFAGEQRPYVDQVAANLKDSGIKVFYDDYEKVELWGRDLYSHLDWVYRKASKYCVVFVSADYAKKVWTNHERSSAQARAIEENDAYILPVRFDDTELPGLRPTIGYLDQSRYEAKELAELIAKKLGPRSVQPGMPTKVDRLWERLGIKGSKKKELRREAHDVAYDLYNAMSRMTQEERVAVAGVLAFGCRGSLPDGVHISLDYLSRMTKMPKAQLLECLTAVRSLNVHVKKRPPVRDHLDTDELLPDDQDIILSFWTPRGRSNRTNQIAYNTIHAAAHHFCEDHGLLIVTKLDFHRLSTAYSGPVALTQDECDA
jgi:hypothetical protein